MIKQTVVQNNNIRGNLKLKYKNIDSLDLIESTRFTEKCCQQSDFHTGCAKCRLSNIKNLNYYFKHKLEDLKFQTGEYKSHFKNSCFNCSSSFHGSSYEDGHFNLQKMIQIGIKCDTCVRNYTMERSFYHNCNECNASFKNCQLLVNHRRTEHNSENTHQCAACHVSVADGVSLIHHIFKHVEPKNNIIENLKLKNENIDFLDIIESKRCTEKLCRAFLFHIGCPKCRLANIKNIKNYLKYKLDDLKLQTNSYKIHFKKSCFNCSFSFHGSSYGNGHFNLQKMFEVERKCFTCIRNFTTERSFYHNCNICNASFTNCKLLVHHRVTEHNSIKPHQCAACNLSLDDKALIRHLYKHKLPHICPHCNKNFARRKNLKLHILSHTGSKPFTCQYCPYQFRAKPSLDLHLFKHTGIKKYKCDLCGKRFITQHLLNRHESVHMQKTFQCNHCPKQFKTKRTLDVHLFEHTGGKQFKCDLCDKTFAKRHLLNRHKFIHMEILFQCKYCPKEYRTKHGLDIHLFEHTGVKQFKCDLCDKSFAKKYLLKYHTFIHMEKSFQCTICLKFFKAPTALKEHIRRVHIEKIKVNLAM